MRDGGQFEDILKSEIRNPNAETNPKSEAEIRSATYSSRCLRAGFGSEHDQFSRSVSLAPIGLQVRISDFGLRNLSMYLARVEGNVVATRKHPSFNGWRLIICQPINGAGEPEGVPQVAIDPHGAGLHQRVIISSDGLATRKAVGDDRSPARWMITAIVDEAA